MINTQQREPRSIHESGDTVEIVSIWETVQGEGPYVGMPCVFVRLAGCNLQCLACDTDYTTNRTRMSVNELIQQIGNVREHKGLVVLTGGEPFRQNIAPLVAQLCMNEYCVQVETNGSMYQKDMPWSLIMASTNVDYQCFSRTLRRLTLVCSPKTPTLHKDLLPYIKCLKYIVRAGCLSPYDGLPMQVLSSGYSIARPWEGFRGEIYLQPEDTQDPDDNKRNTEAALASCMKFGFRMCIQTHKILGME